jgi:hypothetical protein
LGAGDRQGAEFSETRSGCEDARPPPASRYRFSGECALDDNGSHVVRLGYIPGEITDCAIETVNYLVRGEVAVSIELIQEPLDTKDFAAVIDPFEEAVGHDDEEVAGLKLNHAGSTIVASCYDPEGTALDSQLAEAVLA